MVSFAHLCRQRPVLGCRTQNGSIVVVVVVLVVVVVVLGRTVVVVEPGVVVVVVPLGGVTVSVNVPLLNAKPSTMMKYGVPAVTLGATRDANDGVQPASSLHAICVPAAHESRRT